MRRPARVSVIVQNLIHNAIICHYIACRVLRKYFVQISYEFSGFVCDGAAVFFRLPTYIICKYSDIHEHPIYTTLCKSKERTAIVYN